MKGFNFSIDAILADEEVFQQSMSPNFEQVANQVLRKSKPQLTENKRRMIVDTLLNIQKDNGIPVGTISKVAREVGVHRSTISRIYKYIQQQLSNGAVIDVRSKKVGNCGRKAKEYSDDFLQRVPLHLRTTERSFDGYLNIPKTAVHRLKQRGQLRRHTSNNHPSVSDKHKLARLQWVMAHIIPRSYISPPTFVDMRNVIHIDEKWFYLNPKMRRFYLLPKEDDPYRCQQSKRYKIKVMFMGVIGRPLHDEQGNMIHDGKYGIFPFVYHQLAKRKSKNRDAGTMETKAIQNVTREVIRDMLLQKVIPTIKDKWPAQLEKNVCIQWDNARPHQIPRDEDWIQATIGDGWDINMVFQPPQSPDLNVLDLALFRSVQSIHYKAFPKNLDELVENVEDAFRKFDPKVNRNSWITLQHVMIQILKDRGGNNFRIPHVGKDHLEREGLLRENVEVQDEVINEVVQYLNDRFRVAENHVQEEENEVDAD